MPLIDKPGLLPGLLIKAIDYFKDACHRFLVSATKVPELVQLVLNMELLTISSMCEVGSEHKGNLGAFLTHLKAF